MFAAFEVVAGTYPAMAATAATMDPDIMAAMGTVGAAAGAAFLLEDGVYFFVRCFD